MQAGECSGSLSGMLSTQWLPHGPSRLRVLVAAVVLFALFALSGMATTAHAQQELLANGNFDSDVSGWERPLGRTLGSVTWDMADVDDSVLSGSARVDIDPADQGNADRLFQCVDVTEGELYTMGAWVFRPSGSPLASDFIRVQWYSGAGCSAAIMSSDSNAAVGTDLWWELAIVDEPAPTGAVSAEFSITMFENAEGPRVVFLDALTFVPEPSSASLGAVLLVSLAAWRIATEPRD